MGKNIKDSFRKTRNTHRCAAGRCRHLLLAGQRQIEVRSGEARPSDTIFGWAALSSQCLYPVVESVERIDQQVVT